MKYYVFAIAATLSAQSVSSTYQPDLNGKTSEVESTVTRDHRRTDIVRDVNGRHVPLEQTDERLVREDAASRTVERNIKRFDQNGLLNSTERMVIEERKRPNGTTTSITTYRTDVNGNSVPTERQTVDKTTQGSTVKTDTVIERPGINGSFQAVEKRSAVAETLPDRSKEDQQIYQRSENGNFALTSREVRETTNSGGRTTENTAIYQNLGPAGDLRLTKQIVATTTQRADGSQLTEETYYGASWSGRVGDNQSGPVLQEQDTRERRPGAGGSVVETLTARRASANDPGKLGPPVKVSETICTGTCTK